MYVLGFGLVFCSISYAQSKPEALPLSETTLARLGVVKERSRQLLGEEIRAQRRGWKRSTCRERKGFFGKSGPDSGSAENGADLVLASPNSGAGARGPNCCVERGDGWRQAKWPAQEFKNSPDPDQNLVFCSVLLY
jgi:hypothetical protein